ncbi:MAG TPA: hypothetical protein VK966_11685, partial [Longimicrobiales bacterium]|nr:hypothetical protein [Longimicrobiales bacterium]
PEHAATHAPINDGARFRPVLPTTHGTEYALFTGIGHSTTGPFAGRLDLSAAAEVGHFEGPRSGDRFGRVSLSAKWSWNGRARDRAVALGLRGIASWSGPIQHATLLGGLGTLPGHPYHRYLGERVALLDLEAWRTVVPRWLRVRAIAAAAAVSGGSPLQLEASSTDTWTIQAGGLAIPVTVGLGLGVLDGILRVDYALGVSEAASSQGELTISLDPRLHGIF